MQVPRTDSTSTLADPFGYGRRSSRIAGLALDAASDALAISSSLADGPAVDAQPMARQFVATRSGQRLAYVEAGQGRPVILIHGALMILEDMALGPMDALAVTHRVVAFDRPGHGQSERSRLADASPWRQAELIHQAAQALGLERPIIVGHSFGGAVALAYAMAYPEATAGVVALAPIVFPEPRLETAVFGPRAMPGAGDLLNLASRRTTDRALLPILWRAMFLPQPMPSRMLTAFPFHLAGQPATLEATGEDAWAITTDLWRSVASYWRCPVPIRVLGGDRDLVLNNAVHGQGLARLAPRARFRLLPGMGHMLHHFALEEIVAAVHELDQGAGGRLATSAGLG